MKFHAAVFACAMAISTPAWADDAVDLRNAPIVSSDGKVVGKVNRVLKSGSTVSAVLFIMGNKMMTLRADSFTVDQGAIKSIHTQRELERR
jgi:hypothetical protein